MNVKSYTTPYFYTLLKVVLIIYLYVFISSKAILCLNEKRKVGCSNDKKMLPQTHAPVAMHDEANSWSETLAN